MRPSLATWSKTESEQIVLRSLDMNNISIIGTVMAQTVGLEHYELKAGRCSFTLSNPR